jgi:hypothetical protein
MSLAQFGHLRAIISEVPQLAQAFQPDSTPLPQCGQCCLASNDLPHCGQAFHPGWTGVEQDGHPWVVGVAVAGDGGSGCGAVMLVKFTVGPEANGGWAAAAGGTVWPCFDASIISDER